MHKVRLISPRSGTPVTDPCALLTAAQQALNLMLTGQAVSEIETPQLGRVRFAPVTIADMQRYVDALTLQCNTQNGVAPAGGRKPFSFEAWP